MAEHVYKTVRLDDSTYAWDGETGEITLGDLVVGMELNPSEVETYIIKIHESRK